MQITLIPTVEYMADTYGGDAFNMRDGSSDRMRRIRLPKVRLSTLAWSTFFVAVLVVAIYPFMPMIGYSLGMVGDRAVPQEDIQSENPAHLPSPSLNAGNTDGEDASRAGGGGVPQAHASGSPEGTESRYDDNRLVIPKIGVNVKIIDSSNPELAWDRGAWRQGSTPDEGSNTVLSAHRFSYTPPYQETFYLLDRMEDGDMFYVHWNGKKYAYRVHTEKVVKPTAVEILDPTNKPSVTLYTCAPLFSTDNRLMVRGELVNNQ